MVLIRWMAWRKEVEFRVFKKVFLIPNIVDLDKIKARFDDDDSTLKITMPKRVKGISGFKIEEEEEEEEERVDFGDVSEVENREEMQNEEENVERGKSDEHFDKAEIQSEVMRDEERESHVLGEEEETENDNLEKTQQIDDFGSKKTEKQEVDEQLDRTSKSGEAEKETTDDDDDGVGLSKVQGEIGEGLEAKIAETETNAEQFESDKLEALEIDKMIHEVVEKKEEEEENAKVGEKNEDIKLQEETKEEHSKGKKEMVEEKTPEAETNIANDIPMDTLRKTCDEGEEKKSEKMEMKHGEAKEEVDARIGEGFIPKIAETETKAAEFEVEKIRELVENTEENAKVGTQREDNSLIKLQENEEEFQGQKATRKDTRIGGRANSQGRDKYSE